MRASILLLWVCLSVMSVKAAPQKLAVKPPSALGTYVKNGVVVGGVAGDAFSILRMEKLVSSDGTERFVILYGNSKGKPVKNTGYFHINVDEKLARVSIDLAQVQQTAVDGPGLAKLFSASKIVALTEMTMDPIDLSTNIQLNLKQPAEVKAQTEEKNGTRTLVIDLRPLGRG